jgi:hypothetical protein
MKYIKSITVILLLLYSLTGCSYVSDYVEGQITNRASFSIDAEISGNNVILSWSETDYSDDFIGVEIYRSEYENDEYAPYIMIQKISGNPKSYTDSGAVTILDSGVYFYRVGFIHWDDPLEDQTAENGYTGNATTDYNDKTHISKVSGYAKVYIP